MPEAEVTLERRTFAELSRAALGRPFSIADAWDWVMRDEFSSDSASIAGLWVGSVGYENHRDSAEFARQLREAGVERLIDVRELPISRRRGYAKTKLGETLGERGVEYVHMRSLGNPKAYRDLYKSGKAEEGRGLYTAYLHGEQREALELLASMLPEKKTALMCVEQDPSTCHRTVILESLVSELGMKLNIADIP
ncbi:MAG: DUF488 domain-containing protein [Actinobacteria bacterium]|nr:DUF488 domain-containing protein [Actinomycetota bacterium]